MKKSNSQNSCLSQLFTYFSPINKSHRLQNEYSEIIDYKSNTNCKSVLMSSYRKINIDEMECQNFNLNGNYKKIYFYKDEDDDLEQINKNNDSLDINDFNFIEFSEEKNLTNDTEKKIKENNIKRINNLSNSIKQNIRLRKHKTNFDFKTKNKNKNKDNKINKSNSTKNLNENILEKINKNVDINKKYKNENDTINNNDNNIIRVINLSTINNNSIVSISKKNDIISNDEKTNKNNELMQKDNNKNTTIANLKNNIKTINKQQNNDKDIMQSDYKNKKNKGNFNLSQSMGKLNSIIEDYYKNKNNNINNNVVIEKSRRELDDNNLSVNLGIDKVKVTYSSSCDNKKVRRTASSSRGAKVTIFQHYNRTQKIIEDKH